MKRFLLALLLVCNCASTLRAQDGPAQPAQSWREPENLADVVDRLVRYHDFGEYDYEIREVVDSARDYLESRVRETQPGEKLAAVFDIDETSLSNWETMVQCGFCSHAVQHQLYPDPHDPAIVPVLELFNFAKSKGIAAFFLTGRQESLRGSTVKNLNDVGYSGWADLIMRPGGNTEPARVFKSRERQRITDKGYDIVLNIGDQASDLAGCCAERVFKLPNPFYLLQ